MILIADSGATKTAWRLIEGSSIKSMYTEGLNPYYHTTSTIVNVLQEDLLPAIDKETIDVVHFYGAGCDSPETNRKVEDAFSDFFNDSDFHVFHDLLGAARACCKREPGIACILGTGSNSCLYDGEKITEHIPSLAFILGDEGSAGYFGKKLINSYFRHEMPDELVAELEQNYNMDVDYIMQKLYSEAHFSRFIASYGAFLGDRRNHPFIDSMLRKGFENFITRIVKKYKNAESLSVNFVGSVAMAYQELITEILDKHNLQAGTFMKNPMDGLVEFHTK